MRTAEVWCWEDILKRRTICKTGVLKNGDQKTVNISKKTVLKNDPQEVSKKILKKRYMEME